MAGSNGTPTGRDGKDNEARTPPSGRKGEQALVLALATGLSVPQAAAQARIGKSSAYRHMADPAFRRLVSKARDDLLFRVVGRLMAVALKAADTLERQLDSKSESTSQRAAVAVLDNMIKGHQLTEFLRRLEALEEEVR